jgi:hypothetical protein
MGLRQPPPTRPVHRQRGAVRRPAAGWAALATVCLAAETLALWWTVSRRDYGSYLYSSAVALLGMAWCYIAAWAWVAWVGWWRDRPRRGYDPDLLDHLERRQRADAPTEHAVAVGKRWAAAHHHDTLRGDHDHGGTRGDVVAGPVVAGPVGDAPGWLPRHCHKPPDTAVDPDRPALPHQRQPDQRR